MLKYIAIAAFTVGLAGAAVGQTTPSSPSSPSAPANTDGGSRGLGTKSQADCTADWGRLDTNKNGSLDSAEISAGKSSLPASLQSSASVTQAQFMGACASPAAK